MKLVMLDERSANKLPAGSRARKCPLCQRACQPGQWVLSHRLPSNGFVDTSINIHASCAAAVTADCPPDEIIPTNPRAAAHAHRRESRRLAAEQRSENAA